MPSTNVCTPALRSSATACVASAPSRQPSPPMPVVGSQQFGGPPTGQPGASSMLDVHSSEPHASAASQLGPPSVARIANVDCGNAASSGAGARIVAAVGVPPTGVIAVA